MSVKYHVIPRKSPRDPEAAPKYYPSIVKSGQITLRQLARRIAEISTVSTVDTMAVLEALLQLIPQLLSEGLIVRLGALGSFWLRTKTESSETEEDVNATKIKKVLPRFNPGKEFQQTLDNIEFEKQ